MAPTSFKLNSGVEIPAVGFGMLPRSRDRDIHPTSSLRLATVYPVGQRKNG